MSNLTRYGQTALDKTFPDADESVFGHMVLELGMSPDEATQNLRPWVRDLDRSAELSKKTAYVAAFIGAGAGLATAATMGIGLTAILPIAAAAYNFFAGQQSAREQGVRESEYLLLKTCPELLKLIYALTQKGMPREALVECYDDLLGAFTVQFQQRASLGMSDELDHDIVRSFQEIVKQKCEAESLARAIVAETENFTFDTLYQSTEPKAESLPAVIDSSPVATSSPIGTATKLGAALVPASPAADSSHEATALSALLTSPFLSRAWFGAQRTGKSYLAAVASLELSKRGISIYHLNLASYGDEDATYWQHAVKSVRCDLSNLSEMQAQPFIENAIALVHEFFSTRNAILVFDEITLTGSLSNQHSSALDPLLRLVADKIACLASTGTKRTQAIWTLSPDFVAGALSQQTKAVKSLALVFVAIAPGRSVDWNGNRIGFHAESFGNVQRNFPVLTMPSSNAGCDRICFVDGRWLPVGELPSLEDSKPLKQSIKLNARQQLEAAFKASTADQEAPIEEAKSNISKPNLPAKDLMLAIAMLAEWMEENLDVEAEKIYEKYNARRKGFSRPEIRFLLTQIENLNAP